MKDDEINEIKQDSVKVKQREKGYLKQLKDMKNQQ